MHMLKHIVRAMFMSGLVVMAMPTQTVQAADGEGNDARQVKMTFSGSMIPTAIAVQPATITDEELLAGHGTYGQFTFRALRTDETTPIGFGACGDGFGPSLRVVAGGGVFRFEGGSLLTVSGTEGVLCIDRDHLVGHMTETYPVTGGTGRFSSASGTLQLTKTLKAVMFGATGAVLVTIDGELNGTVRLSSEK